MNVLYETFIASDITVTLSFVCFVFKCTDLVSKCFYKCVSALLLLTGLSVSGICVLDRGSFFLLTLHTFMFFHVQKTCFVYKAWTVMLMLCCAVARAPQSVAGLLPIPEQLYRILKV